MNADRNTYVGSDHYECLLATLRYVAKLHARSGGITEVRILGGKPHVGYYDVGEEEQMAKAIAPFVGKANVYFTLNALDKDFLSRAHCRIVPAKQGCLASDADIISYDLFAIDVDPKRAKGHDKHAATNVEKGQAARIAASVKEWFEQHGIATIGADSGNGYHLLIPTVPYTGQDVKKATSDAEMLGKMLADLFDEPKAATIDTGIYNESRIFKAYGTLAMKGTHTDERPHRWAKIDLSNPPEPIDLFDKLKDEIQAYRGQHGDLASSASTMAAPVGDTIPSGQRDNTLTSLAGSMRRRNMSPEAILAALKVENQKCNPPLDESDLVRIAGSIGRKAPAAKDYNLTDTGNSERFADQHADKLCYCQEWGRWLYWDATRWNAQVGAEKAKQLVIQTVRSIAAEASAFGKEKRRKHQQWSIQSESNQRINAMLSIAQSLPRLSAHTDQFDANPYLLNCLSGVVDLQTGKLCDHTPDHMLTKLCPVNYDPNATLKLWNDHLRKVTGGNDELINFLQLAVGYSITGDTREEKLFFMYGPTAGGKTTTIEAIKGVLGDYSQTADFETFLKQRNGGGTRNDIARLYGSRLVTSVEVDEGKELAEGLVKQLTGGDVITARFLYKEHFEFKPTFKLWLVANDAPRARDTDDALWRRIIVVPFEHTIPAEERDPNVKATLCDPEVAGPAILAWMVQGCLRWQREGLYVPETVKHATDEYREAQDPIKDWLEEDCVFEAEAAIPVTTLRQMYEQWARTHGLRHTLSPRQFNKRLEAKGCQRRAQRLRGRHPVKCWVGIRARYQWSQESQQDWRQADDE